MAISFVRHYCYDAIVFLWDNLPWNGASSRKQMLLLYQQSAGYMLEYE